MSVSLVNLVLLLGAGAAAVVLLLACSVGLVVWLAGLGVDLRER